MATITRLVAARMAAINAECFTSDDGYSDPEYVYSQILNGHLHYKTVGKGKIFGYILYRIFPTHIESIRRALTRSARGKGLGVLLSRKLIAVAKKRRMTIFTYVSKVNLPSLNSNFKVGYKITDIGCDWVYIQYTPKGC